MVTAIRCPYVMKDCENKDCKHCPVYYVVIDKASNKLGLCEDYGVDRATVLGMLKDTGNKDNQETALCILEGCPTCMEYFNGGKR